MKLSKIYSNKDNFKPIIFNEWLNIILGDIENDGNDIDWMASEHNLGKTSLVYLIDFLLLKGVKKDNFFGKHKNKFSDWIFFLEIKLNDGKYLTIRRDVLFNTKISFKEHFSKHQNFTQEITRDYKDISINAKEPEKNAKKILEGKYRKFDIDTDFVFRRFIPYLLRNQNDYQDVFKLNKFRGKDESWKPLLFELLWFNPSLLQEKYDLDSEIKDKKRDITKLKGEKQDGEIYKIKAIIEAKEIEKIEIQANVNSFDFYETEQNINFDLVKNIESKISKLNKEEYTLNHTIEQIRKSLDTDNKPSLEISEIKKLFEEVKIFFPDNLSKDYQDVLDFSSQITKEREKYLKGELVELKDKQANVLKELKDLNQKRIEMFSLIKEKDTFVKYKNYQEELIRIETEILTYKQKLNEANTLENQQKSLENIKISLKTFSSLIKDEVNKENEDFKEIKRIYGDIYKKTFQHTALLTVEPNGSGNVDFKSDVLWLLLDSSGNGDGYTSMRVLCASFVLAILIHYSSKSFFRFAYHDWILDSWWNKHKILFINLLREYTKQYDLQYIISLIKSDVPNEQEFKFNDTEIIRTLSKDDKLFDMNF